MAKNKIVYDGTVLLDLSEDTVSDASHIVSGYVGHLRDGTQVTGTGTGSYSISDVANSTGITALISGTASGGATQHSIYIEFSDGTNTTIPVYYDDSLIGTMITDYTPTTYNNKTVTLAKLDGVTWYDYYAIPLNTELIDYTACISDTIINSQGATESYEYYYASDYTAVSPGMTFSYMAAYWFYIGVYDSSYNLLRTIYVMTDATQDSDNSNLGHGTLSGSKLTDAAYVRITGLGTDSDGMSLIRTA